MQLDRTNLVIRTRSTSEIGDLAVMMIGRYAGPIARSFAIGAAPWMIANGLLLGLPLVFGRGNWVGFGAGAGGIVPYVFWTVILVTLQTPAAGIITTLFLGSAVFEDAASVRSSRREAIRRWRSWFWGLGIVRLPVIAMLWVAGRMAVPFDTSDILVGLGLLSAAMMVRAGRPFAPEILMLERRPVWAKEGLSARSRSGRLHGPIMSDLMGRMFIVGGGLSLLTGLLSLAMTSGVSLMLGDGGPPVAPPGGGGRNGFEPPMSSLYGYWMWVALLPAALWMVGCFSVVLRLLSYLDCRIRLEGWDVDLAVRAEAMRQFEDSESDGTRTPSRPKRATTVALGLALTFSVVWLSSAGAAAGAAASEVAREADDNVVLPADSVWFDARAGDIRPVPIQIDRPSDDNRGSRWTQKPSVSNTASGGTGNANGTGGQIFGWALLLIIAAAVAVAITKLLSVYRPSAVQTVVADGVMRGQPDEQTVHLMEQLPEAVRRTDVNLRQETERLIGEGRYDEAVVTLFGHQLLLLDRAGRLRLARGTTNRRYVEQTRRTAGESGQAEAAILNQTVVAFERVYFGGGRLSGDQFDHLWAGNESLERSVWSRAEGGPAVASARSRGSFPGVESAMALMVAMSLGACGCQRFDERYGESRGRSGRESLNGLAAMRQTLIGGLPGEDVTVRMSHPAMLPSPADGPDAIVWTPRDFRSFDRASVAWLERWLRHGGRTLVLVLPDSGGGEDYLRRLKPAAAPEDREDYDRAVARRQVTRLQSRRVTVGTGLNFRVEPIGRPASSEPAGVWPEGWSRRSRQRYESRLLLGEAEPEDASVGDDDAAGRLIWRPVVTAAGGDVLVATGKLDGASASEVVLVGGGTMVSNYGFAVGNGEALCRDIRRVMIANRPAVPVSAGDSRAAGHGEKDDSVSVAMILTDGGELPIRPERRSGPSPSGWAVLTTWPLSWVTIHGLIAGLVVCFLLAPIFGRPRRLASEMTTAMTDHVEAMAMLMHKTGWWGRAKSVADAESLAMDRIDRYRRRLGDRSGEAGRS